MNVEEIKTLTKKVQELYEGFDPMRSDFVWKVWQPVLSKHSLAEVEEAFLQYSRNSKSRFTPNCGDITSILEANKGFVVEGKGVQADGPEKRMHLDVLKGDCRYNLYCYRDAWKMLERGEITDFNEGLKIALHKRLGERGEKLRDFEFPSANDFKQNGLGEKKLTMEQLENVSRSMLRRI